MKSIKFSILGSDGYTCQVPRIKEGIENLSHILSEESPDLIYSNDPTGYKKAMVLKKKFPHAYLILNFLDVPWHFPNADKQTRLLAEHFLAKADAITVISFKVKKDLTKFLDKKIVVIYNPIKDELFTAEKGKGAFLNGERIYCSFKDNVNDMIILNSRSETRRGLWKPYCNHFMELRPIGSVAYKLGLTAAGKADIFASLRPKNEWDICAGNCIINEAGGKLIDLSGNQRLYNQKNSLIESGLIAGNKDAVDKTFIILTS